MRCRDENGSRDRGRGYGVRGGVHRRDGALSFFDVQAVPHGRATPGAVRDVQVMGCQASLTVCQNRHTRKNTCQTPQGLWVVGILVMQGQMREAMPNKKIDLADQNLGIKQNILNILLIKVFVVVPMY